MECGMQVEGNSSHRTDSDPDPIFLGFGNSYSLNIPSPPAPPSW